jgi:hypothetical protein
MLHLQTSHGYVCDAQVTINETKTDNTTKLTTSAKNQVDPAATNYIADLILKLPTNSQYNLTLVTFNGDVIQPQLNCAKETVSTMNGDVAIIQRQPRHLSRYVHERQHKSQPPRRHTIQYRGKHGQRKNHIPSHQPRHVN